MAGFKEITTETYVLPYVKEPVGVWYKSECSGTIWRDTVVREVGSGGRGHMYTYGLFMLMYSKNHHNIEKEKNKKLSDGVRP